VSLAIRPTPEGTPAHLPPHLVEVNSFIADAGEPAGFNPLTLLVRLMRGRWIAAILTALLLGGLFGTAGYLVTTPGYESQAIIRISAREPALLYASGDDSRLKLFNAFVRGEQTFVASRPVMERAADIAGVLPGRDAPLTALGLSRSSTVERREALLVIKAEDGTAAGAAAKVNAILEAYQALHSENDARRAGYREGVLSARAEDLLARLEDIKTRMLEVGGEYGSNSLAKAHIAKIEQIAMLEARLAEAGNTLLAMEARSTTAAADMTDVHLKRAVILDRVLADLSHAKATREAEVAALLVRMEERHMPVVALRAEIAVIDEAIAERREQIATLASTGALADAAASTEETADEVRVLLAKVERDLAEARAEARALNAKRIELTFLEEERGEVRRLLDETRRALDIVRVESRNALPGMVEVISDGAVPEAPANDKRLILGAGGAVAGAGFGGAIFLALGLLSGRLRYSDDLGTMTDRAPLFATLRGRRDGRDGARALDQALVTALHEVRNRIQLMPVRRPTRDRGRIILLAGEGRAPVAEAMALSASFELAGLAPLLVDADLCDDALTRAAGCGGLAGWREILAAGGVLEAEPCELEGVSAFLPGGLCGGVDQGTVSLSTIRYALGELAELAPVVIVYAGAAGNALSREMLAAESDMCLVVAFRGAARRRVERLVRRLDELSRNGAAIVFAGARRNDPGLLA